MPYPTPSAFPSESSPNGWRVYEIVEDVRLMVRWFPGSFPHDHAPGGAFLYTFIKSDRWGASDWARDADALVRIMEAARAGMTGNFEHPEYRAPDGGPSDLHPTNPDLLGHAMEEGRPGPPRSSDSSGLLEQLNRTVLTLPTR